MEETDPARSGQARNIIDTTSGRSEIYQTWQVSQSSLSVVSGPEYHYNFNHFEEQVQCTMIGWNSVLRNLVE